MLFIVIVNGFFERRFAKVDRYQHRRHNKNLLMVHLLFVAKYRKKLFFGNFRDDIKQYMLDTCKRYHWYIRRMEADKDHLHMLLQYNPTDSLTRIVSTLKQHSAYYARKTHGDFLRQHYWKKKTLWSDGYFHYQ